MEKLLHDHADNGNFQELKRLIDRQINSKDHNKQTVLHKASKQGDLMAVQYLIKVGAQLEAEDIGQRTPLHFAKTYEIAAFLIQNGAQVNAIDRDGGTPLHEAKTSEIAAYLIQNGAQVDAIDEEGRTPLHLVEETETATCLIQNGAQVDAIDVHGRTPLHTVEKTELVIVLIQNGAKIDAKDKSGWSPLHEAVIRNKFDKVKCLVENGAQITARTNDGNETPFDLAKEKGLIQIAKYLLEMKKESDGKAPEEKASTKDLCIICLTPKNGFFVLNPCGHAGLCEPCCFKLKNENNGTCPSCRLPISGYQKIFF